MIYIIVFVNKSKFMATSRNLGQNVHFVDVQEFDIAV